jgi:YHS domain-containing protein
VDPVCGARVEADEESVRSVELPGRRYFFCSERCRRTFRQHTEHFRQDERARAGALFAPRGNVPWGLA